MFMQGLGLLVGAFIVIFCCAILGAYLGVLEIKKQPRKIQRIHRPNGYMKPDRQTKNKLRRMK